MHPKLSSLSGEGHYTLRSRPAEEHSFGLVLCFQRAAEALPKCWFLVSVLWAIAVHQLKYIHSTLGPSGIYWAEISAALHTQPVWSLADAQCLLLVGGFSAPPA